MYVLNGRWVATYTGASGQKVQFVLVPYPFRSRYEISDDYRTKEEENRLLHHKIADWVKTIIDQPEFNQQLPTILAAHLHIRGANLGGISKYLLSERDDVLFDFGDLNPQWAYIALGHIHHAQTIGGAANVRYAGSLDRLDFGEALNEPGVLLFDMGKTGLIADPIHLPIAPTPFHTVTLTDPVSELPLLAEKYPDRQTAIVRVRVSAGSDISRDEIERELRRLFPRLHELSWIQSNEEPAKIPATIDVRAGFATIVRDYLNDRLEDDDDKTDLLTLAETFLNGSES
jgi:DNA repair protein SbcD/Mre11